MNSTFLLFFVLPVFLGAIILLAGIIFLVVDARRKKKIAKIETQDWETTGGKIIASRLEQHEAPQNGTAGANAAVNFEPIVEYVYTVKEAEFRSNQIFPGDHIYFSQSAAQEILNQYPLNMYVPVKYNPEDPNMSSLENRPEGMDYVRILGLVLTSFGVLACCFATFMTFIAVGTYK